MLTNAIMIQTVDIVGTLIEQWMLYIIMGTEERRFSRKWPLLLIYVLWFAEVKLLTQIGMPYIPKMLLISLSIIVLGYIGYRCSFTRLLLYPVMFYISLMLPESTVLGVFSMNEIPVGYLGYENYTVAAIVLSKLFQCLIALAFRYFLQVQKKNEGSKWFSILLIFTAAAVLLTTVDYLDVWLSADIPVGMYVVICGSVLIIVFMGAVLMNHYLQAWERERLEKMRVKELEARYAYYQDKQKEEERIRSIYHDLKNHLLVLKTQAGNEKEAHEAVSSLQRQIEDYENYRHTGNDFLDIILRDKSRTAKEKEIDFDAAVCFADGGFIEMLDISTIFGNALDNAIEASMKLEPEERMISVKAARVRDMISVVFENNAARTEAAAFKTTKKDTFLHGYGLDNIKKAVEKYSGQCTFRQEEGRFILNIIIPLL